MTVAKVMGLCRHVIRIEALPSIGKRLSFREACAKCDYVRVTWSVNKN